MSNRVGNLIRKLREQRGVTQRQLAQAIGSNYTYLSKIENGRLDHTPNSKTLVAIADALQLDRDWLLTECGRPPEKLAQSIASHAEFFRRLGQLRGKQLDAALQPFPLLGRVPAGPLAEAIEDSEEFELADLFSPGEHYLLRIRGDSMIEDGIRDGDLAIVRPQSECNDGDVVVTLIDGADATVKRLYRQKSRIKLQPANAAMESLYVEPERVQIRGRVVGLIRTNM
jgi:SOS-response transcriptional repressor LexA